VRNKKSYELLRGLVESIIIICDLLWLKIIADSPCSEELFEKRTC